MIQRHKLTLQKQEKFLKALKKNGGFISYAARAARIHRNTHLYWLRSDETYREKFEEVFVDAIERNIDDVEAVLLRKAKNGEPWAVMLYMRALGKARGYSLRHDPKMLQQNALFAQIVVANEADRQRIEHIINDAQNNDRIKIDPQDNGR